MKKYILIIFCVIFVMTVSFASGADVDISNMTYEELLALRRQIDTRIIQLAKEGSKSADAADGFVYVSNGSEICIKLYEGNNPEVVIPSEIDGLPVTQIHPSTFKGNQTITSVVLPEGMTEIPDDFFNSCSKLENVYLPETVTKIGSGAFTYDSKIKNFTFHEGITELGSAAFQLCRGLTGVVILPKSLKTLEAYVFSRCDSLEGAVIQSNLTISDLAFATSSFKFIYVCKGCSVSFKGTPFEPELEIAILPETVYDIGDSVFEVCNRLTIVCPAGSYAESYAKKHFIMCDTEHYEQYVQEYAAYIP